MTDVAVSSHSRLPAAAQPGTTISIEQAIDLWLAGYPSDNTRRAYLYEIRGFAHSISSARFHDALLRFISLTDAQAHSVVDAFRASMINRGKAAATINRTMACLNSFVASMRRHGLTELRLEARTIRTKPYRDTRGPGTEGVRELFKVIRKQGAWRAARDEAIVRILFALGLRRAELVELDMDHVDRTSWRISIKGKGAVDRVWLDVPEATARAIDAWIARRGDGPGPLFVNVDRKSRISGAGMYYLIASLGRSAGLTRIRPHGIRHAAITAVLDATNGDVRKAQAFGRHANAQTTLTYDDNRQNLGGSAARLLDGLVD